MTGIDLRSPYFNLANKELSWLISDTEERYKSNLKSNKGLLEQYNWIDKQITYKFNSLGFRSSEFDGTPSIMFLGCSRTLGVGLPLEVTWPQLVAKELNLNCANLAVGGGSADTAFRMCLGYLDKINPKMVVYWEPPPGRLELLRKYYYHHYQIQIFLKKIDPKANEDFLSTFAACESNELLNYKKNLLAIKLLCLERNIKFLHLEDAVSVNTLDYARDLMHWGPIFNKEFADFVLTQI